MKHNFLKKGLILLLTCTLICVATTVDAKDYADYFEDASGVVSAKENAEDIVLSCNKDGKITFSNVLSCKDFSLNMKINKSAANCKKVSIKLADAKNKELSKTFYIDMKTGNLMTEDQKVAFAAIGEEMELIYNNTYQGIFDEDQKELLACKKDDAGNAFKGFEGGVYLTIGFEGVTGKCELHLLRLNNQALGHRGKNVGDLTEPMIQLTSSLNTRQYVGENFQVPTFDAFDVYSEVVEKTVTVATPSGEEYVSDDKGNIDSFKISEYGRYRLTYYAEDDKGNSAESIYFVNVNDDVVPVIDVKDTIKKTYKVGAKVSVPTYKAEDNLGAYSVDVILVLPNSELRLLSHDENGEITYYLNNSELYNTSFIVDEKSFCVEQEGEYIIRYVAYDEFFNRDVVELVFNAK